ncbi:MAG: aromatic hydrocarbon degradation protein [Flavobacterium sp.]|nr:aromatic hydrocarbon degradation protein [Flavobacterium sp.]
MKRIIIISLFMLLSIAAYCQSVATSPYSIYGLGSLYQSDFGPISAMGGTGIALPSSTFINNKNPSSLAFIGKNSFFYDFGAKTIFSTYKDKSKTEKKKNTQFSHIAFAFPVNSKSGISIALLPYSSASYVISNYRMKINNSNEYYYLDAESKGGLNSFDVAYGYQLSKKLALGIKPSVYFGSIEENKNFSIANSITTINTTSNYKGVRFTLGSQFCVDSTFVLGLTVKTPAKISAGKKQSIKSVNGTDTEIVAAEIVSDAVNYYLPLEIGFGVNKRFKNNMSFSVDYEKSLWNSTNQSSIYGQFTNQDKLSVGFSYFKDQLRKTNFYEKIHYYLGMNYDSGFLLINDQKVDNIAFSVGFGIPLEHTNSQFNISYSYGIKAKVSNDLIKENYHKIGINFSFEAIWFMKGKYE